MEMPAVKKRRGRIGTALLAIGVVLAVLVILINSDIGKFTLLQMESSAHAGTWEDDPENWRRAFDEKPPTQVKVIHSKYWRSNHFTLEFMYYFEIEATPEWKDAYLKKRGLHLVSPSKAWSFREGHLGDGIPAWFAPDPSSDYEVWDIGEYNGCVWINKHTGHIFFSDAQL